MCWLLILILDSIKCSRIYFVIISTIKMSITEKWPVLKMQCIISGRLFMPSKWIVAKKYLIFWTELNEIHNKTAFLQMMCFWLFACLFWVCFYNFAFIWQKKNNRFLPFFWVFLVCIFISCMSICRYFVFHQGPQLNYRVK